MATEFKLNYTGAEINEKLAMVDETKNTLANYYYTSIDIDNKFSENESQTNIKFDDVNSKLEEVDIKFGQIDSELEEIATKTDEHDSHLESIDNKLNENDATFENINTRFGEINSNLLLKADLVDGKIPAEQLPDDIGGGASSWNDLEDKPFESSVESVALADNLSFTSSDMSDGEGLFYGAQLELTSYETGDTVSVLFDGVSYEFTKTYNEDLQGYFFGNLSILNFTGSNFENTGEPFVLALAEDNGSWMCVIYLADTQATAHSISISTVMEIVKTLDIKYLPQNMALGYEEKPFEDITWDGDTEGLTEVVSEFEVDGATMKVAFYKVSDETPSISETIGREITYIGDSSNENSSVISEGNPAEFSDNGSYLPLELYIVVCLGDNTVLSLTEMLGAGGDLVFPETGIWFAKLEQDGTTVVQTTSLMSSTTLVQIDEKFIPDTIARQSDLDSLIQSLDSSLTSAIGSGVLE